jgi:signal transduction histidine kinase
VARAIGPLHELLKKTRSIAEGNMEVHIPRSNRIDAVGRLQNSFAAMLESLNFHMGSVRYTSEQTQHRNEELVVATRLAEESDRQKTAFIQNVTHQIRTPLNIIMGFAQVLRDSASNQPSEDDMKSITKTMDHNAKLLYRLVSMLFDSSDAAFTEELNSPQMDMVPCNEVGRETLHYLKEHYPDVPVTYHSEVDDNFCFQSNHLYIMRCLRELLYNAAKYSDGKNVSLSVSVVGDRIRFIVQDTGKGIAESDRELMFKFFTKVDDLSEGLGLGLPLAKRHAQNLGGDLTLDENYHDGCRFIVDLPLRKA